MRGPGTSVLRRAWRRLRRDSTRVRDRVRGLPVRAKASAQGLPIPPGRLIHLVAGTEDVSWFLGSGMDELLRVLRPGGHLFLTTHGACYLDRLSPGEQAEFHAGRSVIHDGRKDGSNDVAVFHPESHVRKSLARGFAVVEFVPEGALSNPRQDAWLLRKPGR